MSTYNEVIYQCLDCGAEIVDETKSGSCSMRVFYEGLVPIEELKGLDKIVHCEDCGSNFFVNGMTHVSLYLSPYSA